MSDEWVFVSLAACGHAESVYADVMQSDGSRWVDEIMADLRAGLTVQRMTVAEFQIKYASTMLCNCADTRTTPASSETASIQKPKRLML